MGGSTTTIEPGIPKAAKPSWEKFASTVENMIGNIPDYGRYTGPATQKYGGAYMQPYTDPFTAWMDPMEEKGMAGIQEWAQGPGQLETTGRGLLDKTMQGGFLTPDTNPFLRQMTEGMMGNMSKAIGTASEGLGDIFRKAGVSYRGPAENRMRTGALSDFSNAMTGLYGNVYESERGRMMGALPMAQAWSQMPYMRGSAMMGAGALPRQLRQRDLTSRYGDWLRTGEAGYGEDMRTKGLDYADWLRYGGEKKEGFYKPYDLRSGLLGNMPLAYPQQQYNKGFLDYIADLAPTAWQAFA